MRNRFLYQNLPMYAGPDARGGGIQQINTPLDQIGDDFGVDNGGGDNNSSQQNNQGGNDRGGNQGDDQISLDPGDILSNLWGNQDEGNDGGDSEGDGSGDGDSGNGDGGRRGSDRDDDQNNRNRNDSGNNRRQDDSPVARAGRAAVERIQQSLRDYRLPDDTIPENIDLTDRTQLTGLLTNVGRNAAQQGLQLALGLMREAMSAQHNLLTSEMDRRISADRGNQRLQSQLEAAIPEARDPALAPLVRTIFDQTRTRHPKDSAKAIQATKQALQAIGIKLGAPPAPRDGEQPISRTQRNNQQNRAPGIDAFFDIPKPQTNRTQDRMRRGNG